MGVCVPEAYGGAGADFLSYILVLEELSRADAGVGVTVAVHTSACTLPLLAFGTDEQRSRFVPPLARGETIGAFALTEPGAGSDAGSLRARAERTDAGWRLTGTKQWVTNGSHAGTFLVFARTDPETPGARGVSAFVLDAEHVEVTREEEKLGLNSSSTADLAIDAEVPADRLLHEEGKGFHVAMATLDGGRIGIAAQAVGIARAAFEVARDYAKERETFGRPLAEHQAIQAKLADMATEIDAARLLTHRAAWLKDRGEPVTEAGAMAKLYASATRPPPDRRGDPDPRGLRLHEGVPGRALLPRREDHRDLRGDERDPADRDRAEHPRAAARPARAGRSRPAGGGGGSAGSRPRMSPRRPDEPVRLTRIYTRTGDAGETHLGDLSRVRKTDPLVEAFGAVDELNAAVGLARAAGDSPVLERVQNELFDLGADLSVPYEEGDGKLRVTDAQVERLERDCDAANEPLAPLRSFVLPGGTEAGARLHLARTVCRRAERETLRAAAERPVNPVAARYLNRLSDLLFILARAANGGDEPLWKPGESR